LLLAAPTETPALYRSFDAGRSWQVAESRTYAEIQGTRTVLAAGRDDFLYLATRGDGVWRSVDAGETWVPFDGATGASPLPSLDVLDLAVRLEEDGTEALYALTPRGISRTVLSDLPALSALSTDALD
jgi:hypothetical protein